MKTRLRKKQNLTKGIPSALVLSILIHAALFLLAGMLVVFSVVNKKEQVFVPPKPVDRPKMKLKKPKVKVRKSAKPKSSQRIVTNVKRASMPDIQLPEMSGMGDGVGTGMGGGFEIMPDLGEITLLGSRMSAGNDLMGVYYDTKRDRNGRGISCGVEEYRNVAHRFIKSGWRPSILSRYYQAPHELYTTSVIIPETKSSIAPLAFSDEEGVGALWLIHYKGELVHQEGITFRFYAAANEFMFVRVDGEIVVGSSASLEEEIIGEFWQSNSLDTGTWMWGRTAAQIGDWITLEPGVPLKIEILLGDNGNSAGFILAVEVEDEKYERSSQGAPILPAFKTDDLTRDHLDVIYKELPENLVCLTNGPVFRDF